MSSFAKQIPKIASSGLPRLLLNCSVPEVSPEKIALYKKNAYYKTYQEAMQKKFRIFFHQGNGMAQITPEKMKSIFSLVKEDVLSDSFMVYDKRAHIKKIQDFKEKLPWIKPYYAVKCNPQPEFIQTFLQQDPNFSFDVASLDEMDLLFHHFKVDPSNIVYASSVRNEIDIAYSQDMKVNLINADTIEELIKLKILSDPQYKNKSFHEIKKKIKLIEKNIKKKSIFSKKYLLPEDLIKLDMIDNNNISKMDREFTIENLQGKLLQWNKDKQRIMSEKQQKIIFQNSSSNKLNILWRLACIEDPAKNRGERAYTYFGDKFGDLIYEGKEYDIKDQFLTIKELGIDLKGVHFHSGSCHKGSKNFEYSIEMAKKVMKYGRQCGHSMNIMDIGGGFPGTDLTNEYLQQFIKCRPGYLENSDDITDYQVISEPGRYFATQCYFLLARVIGHRFRDNAYVYQINDGLYNLMSCVWSDGYKLGGDKIIAGINHDGQFINVDIMKKKNCQLYGQTCDSADKLAPYEKNDELAKLPEDLEVGDWICFGGMGAYTFSAKTKFNSMRCLSKVYQIDIN